MDFIEGLPKSKGRDIILVVVDRLTKYAYFLALAHPFYVPQVAHIFCLKSSSYMVFHAALFLNMIKYSSTISGPSFLDC